MKINDEISLILFSFKPHLKIFIALKGFPKCKDFFIIVDNSKKKKKNRAYPF